MASARDLELRPIPSKDARRVVSALHYSGKSVLNSKIHLGVFLDGRCGGAIQFGPSLQKRSLIHLVEGTGWDQFIELNRLALADWLPRNSESRVLAVSARLLKRHYPQLKWVVSFADACRCGDGTIYRASGFVLTGIKRNDQIAVLPNGETVHWMRLVANPDAPRPELGGRSFLDVSKGKRSFAVYLRESGAKMLQGWQIRYVRFLDPSWRARLTVPELPFSAIEEAGASMYRGERAKRSSDAPLDQRGEGGAIPTRALQV